MNLLFMILILESYFLICFITYAYLYKIRNLISYHFGMNLAMSSGGVMGIAIGTILGSAISGPLYGHYDYCNRCGNRHWSFIRCIS